MISVLQLGRLDYATALRLQQRVVELRKQNHCGNALLLLEHTPVITLGRNASDANILASREQLAARGVEVFECDRGGDVTFHGPGQLVGYPIFDLRSFTPRLGAVDYVRRLEEALMRACQDFGIATQRVAGLTGVWTADTATPAKMAAIGVHISRGVTSHGFALNVNTALDWFRLIVPCGLSDKPVSSIAQELGREVAMDDVAHAVARHFGHVFGAQVLWLDGLDDLLAGVVANPQDTPARPPEELRKIHDDDIFLA